VLSALPSRILARRRRQHVIVWCAIGLIAAALLALA
jgi:hypothetical protein